MVFKLRALLSCCSPGGVAGLMVCLFARFQEWWDKKSKRRPLVSKVNDTSSCYNNIIVTVHLIMIDFQGRGQADGAPLTGAEEQEDVEPK